MITTARLRLPLLTLDDCRVIEAAPPRPPEWADGYPTDPDVGLARMLLAAGVETTDWGLRRVLLLDGTVVGGIGLFGPPDAAGVVSLGYGFATSARGSGYATEAVVGITAWAGAHGAREARADTLVENVPSRRVLERAGFVRTGQHDSDEGPMYDYALDLAASLHPWGSAPQG